MPLWSGGDAEPFNRACVNEPTPGDLTSAIASLHLTYPEVTPEQRQALEEARAQLEKA